MEAGIVIVKRRQEVVCNNGTFDLMIALDTIRPTVKIVAFELFRLTAIVHYKSYSSC